MGRILVAQAESPPDCSYFVGMFRVDQLRDDASWVQVVLSSGACRYDSEPIANLYLVLFQSKKLEHSTFTCTLAYARLRSLQD
jgi:hypothetical protein